MTTASKKDFIDAMFNTPNFYLEHIVHVKRLIVTVVVNLNSLHPASRNHIVCACAMHYCVYEYTLQKSETLCAKSSISHVC